MAKKLGPYLPFVLFLIISLTFATLSMWGLKQGQFLYIGDQFLKVSLSDAAADFFSLRKIESFGVHNAWQLIVQFWDNLYFLVVYSFGASVRVAEFLLFTLAVFITLSFSFVAFKKISLHFYKDTSLVGPFLVTLFYTFNPYTFVLWHGGVYSLGTSFTYGFAPILLYLLLKSFFLPRTKYTVLAFYSLISMSFFVFWLFAPLALYLGICFIVFSICIKEKKKLISLYKDYIIFLAPFLVILSFILYALYIEFVSKLGYNDPFRAPAFGNQSGGLLYIFKLYFSWGIYNFWTPRTIYPKPVTDYLFSNTYLLGIVLLYTASLLPVFLKLVKRTTRPGFKLYLFQVICFFFFAFFAKADQAPFGEVFLWLYKNVPIFRVFRTADVRFGFVIILSLSTILLYVIANMRKVGALVTLLVVLILGYPLLNGKALVGYEIKNKFYDRVFYQTPDSREITEYVNSLDTDSAYVVLIPPNSYSTTTLGSEKFIGQDVLAKYLDAPVVYVSKDVTGMYHPTYDVLAKAIEEKDSDVLESLPIRGFLVRRDVACSECFYAEVSSLVSSGYLTQEFSNSNYQYLSTRKSTSLVENTDSHTVVTPTFIKVVSPDSYIKVNLSYSPHWRYLSGDFDLLQMLFTNTETSLKPVQAGSFMAFNDLPSTEHGSLFYLPQLTFMRLFIVSMFTQLCCLLILVKHRHDV